MDETKLAAINAVKVQGILEWAKALMEWLAKQNLPALLAAAKDLYDTCVAALADGKLTFLEVGAIVTKALALIMALKLAGVEDNA
jgi:hypothetical protein